MADGEVQAVQATSDAERGRDAAQALWRLGLRDRRTDDLLTAEFASAALAELELLQQGTPGVLREVLEGAQMSAEQLNVESFHGLIEIVQNADDLCATEVRFAVEKSGRHGRLLIAHNGERVHLHHVIAMTLAFVSTKRDDPRAKGRFGIGLKILGRLGESLTVHCAPFDFTIEANHVRAAHRARSISGFYDAASGDTLLDLRLREGFDASEFQSWFASLGPESMVFLDTVRSLRLVALGRNRALVHHRLTEAAAEVITLPGIKEPCRRTVLHALRSTNSWERYEIERRMPPHLHRRYKARDEVTPIAVSVSNGEAVAQIYAGLPLGAPTQLPFSLNAQFDIDVARRGIQHEPLNSWLFERLAELTAAVALDRLASDPGRAWRAIPLKTERFFPADVWLADRLSELVDIVQARVRRGFRLRVGADERRLRNLAYEAEPLEGLLTQAELDGLRPGLTLLPKSARDAEERWRAVLAEVGGATLVDVRESLRLLDWSDDDLGPRDVRWFIKLARAAIEADLGEDLWSLRSVVASGGNRIVPPMADVEGELLLRSPQNDSLAFRLGLAYVIDPVYLSRWTDAVVVREWLEENDMLRDTADPESTLRALAARDDDEEPILIGDDDLRLMRDALASLDSRAQQELGPEIGGVIGIDLQYWQGSKRMTDKGRPGEAYLPASIEDRTDGWSKAAGRTPGLTWIHPRYEDVLRRPGRRRAGAGEPKPLAARAFFGLLGAEVAPRLVEPSESETRYGDPASPINSDGLRPPQVEALRRMERHATHLKGERLSPDLLAVLKNLQGERELRARRQRARALLSTLEREWTRLYASHTDAVAVWSYGSWHAAGTTPTTWLAYAMDEAWLTSEDGKKKPPRELAVRTPATEAIFGDDRSSFGYELDETDAESPTVRALGIQTDPQVSEMVEQLVTLRDAGGVVDERTLALRYAAIGAACKKRDPSPDDMVGDLPMRKLRARFGTQVRKPGLIYANGRWLVPSRVFLGAPIFGRRRAFVSERAAGERLWRALRIVPPSVSDCVDVLTEIARQTPDEHDEQVLVNTYLYLEAHLASASSRELARLRTLPAWNGAAWQTARPLHVVADADVAEALSTRLAIWKLPISPAAVPGLIAATDATLLADVDFDAIVHQHAFVHGAALERQFAAAVELLRDWLTRHDPKLFEAGSASWEELARPRIALDPQLEIQLRLNRRTPVSVPARAHVTRHPLTFYFADTEAPAEDENGGRVVASLFTGGDRDKLALAWSSCWIKAARGARGAVTLVEDGADGAALASLFDQAKGTATIPRRQRAELRDTAKAKSAAEPSLPVRRLKQIDELSEKVVDVIVGDNGVARKQSGGRGLRDNLPGGKRIGGPRPAPQTAPLAYSGEEKEELALQVLQIAINGDAAQLRDYRHLRGIGADALDKLRRYFELKTTYGPLPDDITLTANEAERAFREGERFFLAVVAGLEEGYETVVKIFPNPLRTLDFKPSTSVTLAGITGRRSALEVRFPTRDDEDTAANGGE
jgi:hypothetical protein